MTTPTATTTDATEPSANFNRASAGYTWDMLITMIAGIADGFYTYSGNASHLTTIGHRDNHKPAEHAAHLEAAARIFKRYGIKVRRNRIDGRLDSLTVIGPKRGGSPGRYSV